MFWLPRFLRSRPAPKVQNRFCPRFEQLEDRYCPATHITLAATVLPNHEVQLSGSVSGGQISGVQVQFTGAAAGSTTTDSNGAYSYTTSMASLGAVHGVGTYQQETTDTADATVAVTAPSLSLSISYGTQRNVTLSGTLTDIDAVGRTVTINGAAAGSVTTDSTGHFSLTTTAMALGAINATTTDLWGQSSNTASVTAASNVPVIQNFSAVHGLGTTWTFSGTIVDESAAGLTVNFGGNLLSVAGQSVTVQADGTFSYTKTLSANESGTVTAIVTDWWSLTSDEVWATVS